MGANVYMRVCFFVLGTYYKVLSYYISHLAQTVILILFFLKNACMYVFVCVSACVWETTPVCARTDTHVWNRI